MVEENITKKTGLANRVFYIVFVLLILFSVGFTFWRIVINKDYQITAEISCDASAESCFHYEPEPCAEDDTECLAEPPEEAYDYKLISKKAVNIYACEQTDERIDCGEELSCLDGEEGCSYIVCDPEDLAEDEACAEPSDIASDDTDSDTAEGTNQTEQNEEASTTDVLED